MFFLIAGIVCLVVVALAIIGYRFCHHDGSIYTCVFSGFAALIMLTLFFIQVGDKWGTQRRLDAYTKSGYQFGVYRVITELENYRTWADTPFSLWTNEEIDKDLKKARQVCSWG